MQITKCYTGVFKKEPECGYIFRRVIHEKIIALFLFHVTTTEMNALLQSLTPLIAEVEQALELTLNLADGLDEFLVIVEVFPAEWTLEMWQII